MGSDVLLSQLIQIECISRFGIKKEKCTTSGISVFSIYCWSNEIFQIFMLVEQVSDVSREFCQKRVSRNWLSYVWVVDNIPSPLTHGLIKKSGFYHFCVLRRNIYDIQGTVPNHDLLFVQCCKKYTSFFVGAVVYPGGEHTLDEISKKINRECVFSWFII